MPIRYYEYVIDGLIDIRSRYRHNLSGVLTVEKVKVKVSPKFQVVIPKPLRDELKIVPGQELLMYVFDGSLHLVPLRSIKELRGIAKGMRWKDEYRDHSERF
jgi:AbrB family looped-hinge helix DNA binding protein